MPLGKLSKKQIETAYKCLTECQQVWDFMCFSGEVRCIYEILSKMQKIKEFESLSLKFALLNTCKLFLFQK